MFQVAEKEQGEEDSFVSWRNKQSEAPSNEDGDWPCPSGVNQWCKFIIPSFEPAPRECVLKMDQIEIHEDLIKVRP